MKKRMSRFLSGILSATTLFTMIGINSTNAAELPKADIERKFSTACEYCDKNSSILNTVGKIDMDKFTNVVIYKSINLIKTHFGEKSEDFIKQLISRMSKTPLKEFSNDQRLNFLSTLSDILLEMIEEKKSFCSETTYEQFEFFSGNLFYMVSIIEDISTKTGISEHDKNMCVLEILHTIREMGGVLSRYSYQHMMVLSFATSTRKSPELKDEINKWRKYRKQYFTRHDSMLNCLKYYFHEWISSYR